MRNYSIEYVSNIIFFIIILLTVPSLSLAKYLCKSDCEPNYEIITDDLSYPWGLAFLDETLVPLDSRVEIAHLYRNPCQGQACLRDLSAR